MRTGSAGLFQDKKRCKMIEDDRCILCDRDETEDVEHFMVKCDEFRWERQKLLRKIEQLEGTDEWVGEYRKAEDEGKLALLLGRRVEGMSLEAISQVNDWIMEEMREWW